MLTILKENGDQWVKICPIIGGRFVKKLFVLSDIFDVIKGFVINGNFRLANVATSRVLDVILVKVKITVIFKEGCTFMPPSNFKRSI